ncbi:MAG: hypothetical protein ACYC3R_03705 [Thiomonas delicata]
MAAIGQPAGSLARLALAAQLGHHLLHRAARNELDHHEGQQQHAEQRRDHQQQSLGDVPTQVHGCLRAPGLAGGNAHQQAMAQLSGS